MTIEVRRNRKGRAVYATRTFVKGETIEIVHVIVDGLPWSRRAHHPCNAWIYEFFGKCAIALGAGSLYNHSYTPNADWTCRRRSQTIRFYATRTIKLGEEILINYSGAEGPGDDDIEFEVLR